MNNEDHLKQLEHRLEIVRDRVTKLENNHNLAALTERHMNERFDRVETSLETLKSTLNKVNWIVIAAVLAAVMKLVLTGDFNVP